MYTYTSSIHFLIATSGERPPLSRYSANLSTAFMSFLLVMSWLEKNLSSALASLNAICISERTFVYLVYSLGSLKCDNPFLMNSFCVIPGISSDSSAMWNMGIWPVVRGGVTPRSLKLLLFGFTVKSQRLFWFIVDIFTILSSVVANSERNFFLFPAVSGKSQ